MLSIRTATGITTAAALALSVLAGARSPAKSETPLGPQPEDAVPVVYAVVPHPDDELEAWPLIEHAAAESHVVWVTMTRGEQTDSCLTEADATSDAADFEGISMVEGFVAGSRSGPYKYQGTGSPTSPPEPDKGEQRPFGFPWVGRGSEACADARLASWHWFLDEMGSFPDSSVPSMDIGADPWADDDFRGSFCPRPGRHDGRKRWASKIGCVDVWADERGARVAFSLPDLPGGFGQHTTPTEAESMTSQDVVDAIQLLRRNRGAWGISGGAESAIVSSARYGAGYDGRVWPDCSNYPHPDHKAVSDAVRFHDLGIPQRYGVATCAEDPYLVGAEAQVVPADPATLVAAQYVDPITEERIGPWAKHYGWLFPTYAFEAMASLYWRVDQQL